MSLSLFGIILGLVLLMFLAYKGYSIIWVAPVCAVVVAVLSGYAILDAYIGDYMKGMADYVLQWFPAFFLGAVYGLFHLPGRRPAPHPAARRHCHRRLRHHHDRRARHPPDSEPDPHRLLRHHHHGGSAPVPCGLRRYAAARLYLPGVAGAPVPPQGPALCPRPQAQGSGSRLQGSALLALGHRHRPPGGRCAHAQPVPLAAQSLCRH